MTGSGTLIRVVPPIDLAYLSTDAAEVYSFRLSMLALAKPLKNLGIRLLFWLESGVIERIEVAESLSHPKSMAAGAGN